MKAIVGILNTLDHARLVLEKLRDVGITDDFINLLTPGDQSVLASVTTTENERRGTGLVIGGNNGGVLSGADALIHGSAAEALTVPGVGVVMAIGDAAGAIMSTVGKGGAAVAGESPQEFIAPGIPIDQLFLYEDALRRNRTIVIAFVPDPTAAENARDVLRDADAESIDAARENWWLGVGNDARSLYYEDPQEPEGEKVNYRRGFETALHPAIGRRPYVEAVKSLRAMYPKEYADESFRHGYRKGYFHYRELISDR
jgi:hypothetical protein